MKTAYASIKCIEVMHALRKEQALSFYYKSQIEMSGFRIFDY